MIPYGLLGPTDKDKKQKGPFKPGEGYWLGNQFIFPTAPPPNQNIQPKSLLPQIAAAAPVAPAPTTPGILGTNFGDGPQGEGYGGGPSPGGPSPGTSFGRDSMDYGGMPGQAYGSIPSLPSPAPTAPAPGLAPATGLAAPAPEQDPNDMASTAEGKAASESGNKGKADPVAAAAAGTSAYGKELRDTITSENFMDSMRSMAEKAKQEVAAATMGLGVQSAVDQAMAAEAAAQAQSSEQHGDPAAGGGNASGGGVSTGQNNDGPDSPGYRKGGPIPEDGDRRLEPVKIVAHESEFVLRPEAAKYYGKGILGAMNAKKIPRSKLSGLLGDLR